MSFARHIKRNGWMLGVVIALAATAQVYAQDNSWAGWSPGQPGPYAIGHASYILADSAAYDRPVAVSVFYPVDPRTINPATPMAEYQLDPWSNHLPITTSPQWEGLGVGISRAYEGPTPSHHAPFPLIIVSPAYTGDHWQYIFLGTSLASQGFVVAVTDHYNEGQWPWSSIDDYMVTLFNRTHDLPFVITELLKKNVAPRELLRGTMDPQKIAMIGHSMGGNAAYALAAGYNDFCDELWASNYYGDPTTEPQSICVSLNQDRRIRAFVAMDGVSMNLRYDNLAKINIPSLIMGETVENSATIPIEASSWLYRAHAAIDRRDSHRVEIQGANHYSFTNYCEAGPLLQQLGVLQMLYDGGFLPGNDLAAWDSVFPCAGPAEAPFDPVTIAPALAHQVVDTYVLAFLNTYFPRDDPISFYSSVRVLTPQYAIENEPLVYFYDSERCEVNLPSELYSFQPVPDQCAVAQKDPAEFFAP